MANQIVVSAGAKVRNLDGVLTGTSGVVNSLPINASNGIPQLDVNGKILVSQLPNSVMEYQGVWNANTNNPTLTNGGAFNQGDVYLCNVAGTTDFGAGPISFVVSDQVIYSGSIWQKASGTSGTVTSVASSITGNAVGLTGSPITTAGTLAFAFAGTNLQYVNGAGNLTTFPTLITSIGLSMPSAFSVANSPLTANGTIAVTGAGYASQYIRGDGTLADFPSSGGGGSSVSYYLNGGTSQGTIGGTTYYEMSKTADTGTGVDFTKSGDGFIVAFLTDANDPAQLNIPAGNWNYEIYASMSANGGTPQMYAELYKYDGTTFTLISTSSNEILYDGTNLNLYTFGMTVPATTLTLTDRLAIKLYATNSGGKTTTVHTQDSHLCQVITTFSTGITALNGLTAQVQYFQTGTSGTDFNISSTTATHTFNLPTASATNRGALSSVDWSIFNGKQPQLNGTGFVKASGTTITYDNSTYYLASNPSAFIALTALSGGVGISYNNTTGVITNSAPDQTVSLTAGSGISVSGTYPSFTIASTITQYTDALARAAISLTTTGTSGAATYNSTTGVFNIPNYTTDLSNYVDLTTAQTIGGTKTFSNATKNDGGIFLQNGSSNALAGYMNLGGLTNGLKFTSGGGISNTFTLPSATGYTFTFPSATGTIALTSDVPSLSGTAPISYSAGVISISQATTSTNGYLSSTDWNTFNLKQAQLNGTGFVKATGTTISYDNTNYLPLTGGTLTGPLAGTSGTFSQIGIGASPVNFFSVRTGVNNIFDIYDNGTGPAIQSVNDGVTLYRPLFFFATAFTFSNSVTATSFVKTSGTSSQFLKADGSVDSSTYALDSAVVHNTGNETVGGTKTFSDATKNNGGIFLQNASSNSLAGYMNIGGLTNGVKFTSGGGISNTFTLPSATGYTYTFPSATGTIALTSDIPSLTGYVNTSGTPTTNYLPKFTGTSTIGNSLVYDNGTNVAIGATSGLSSKLTVIRTGAGIQDLLILDNLNYSVGVLDGVRFNLRGFNFEASSTYGSADNKLTIGIGTQKDIVLTQSGNLGLGVTPSAWGAFKPSLQVGTASLSQIANRLYLTANGYYSGSAWTYIDNDYSTQYFQQNGQHIWNTAPIGTGAITFTQAMTLTAAGRLLLGTTTESTYLLDVNGTGRFSGLLTISGVSNNNFQSNRVGTNAHFQTWYESNGTTRRGYFGYGEGGSNNFFLLNEQSGTLNIGTNGATNLTIASTGAATFSGDVGIGVTPTVKLDVNGTVYIRTGGILYVDSLRGYSSGTLSTTLSELALSSKFAITGGNVLIGTTTDATGKLQVNGTVYATGFYESSDIRFKNIIETNPNINLSAIDVIKFTRKDNDTNQVRYGYSAQQVQSILPDAVTGSEFLNVNYLDVHTLKIAQLEKEIKELKAKLN